MSRAHAHTNGNGNGLTVKCCGKEYWGGQPRQGCRRTVVFSARKLALDGSIDRSSRAEIKFYCSPHFDGFLASNWDALDQYEIERLSEDDRDFDRYSSEPLCQFPRPLEPKKERAEEREGVSA